ncbi:glycoside hydrolase family 2 protein [Flavobacterium agrisoli]|uniref:DUF4982 domain-containing protein n=1 Tax=Flavobacterium agrisoli TaxID=2793066 RepID=A0A934PN74_9FLAO|nr:glycoside hydrolase family 2 TIM barrel-domain containing protein [Flavobacterium agrisoli]MBK0369508.1 DUF4982 domain-containing protein [Flavobacterium agrisoli]
MKILLKYFPLLLILLLLLAAQQSQAQSRTKTNFGSDWEFKREKNNSSNWEKISIPHTAKIEPLVVNNQFQGNCWYQKTFSKKLSKHEKAFLYFEGVMQQAEVWINDSKLVRHQGGYLPFTIDLTPFLNQNKKATVKVKVNNEDNPNFLPGKPLKDLDFNYYGGIYRNVHLITTSKLYITDAVAANKMASGGLYVNFENATKKEASGTIQVHLKNEFPSDKKTSLQFILKDKYGNKTNYKSEEFILKTNSDTAFTQKIVIQNPHLWSIHNPHLYELEVQVLTDNKVTDSQFEKIGIRKSELKEDGYYLNDEKLFISGTNQHQEYPYLGYALSDEAQFRDAVKIKNAGFDFVRMSHYPHAEAFLSACDSLGILVMNSLTGWQFFGNETFQQNAYQDLRDMARRDRNHPSIIFWEASLNETRMSNAFMEKATQIIKEELPFDHNYTACWLDNANYDLFIPARQHGKAPHYWNNYKKGNRKIFIAEYGDWEYYAQNAGFNQTDFADLKENERTSRQLRADGEKRLLQQAYNFQEASNSNRKGKNTIGEANWLMFDYNRGYSSDLESSGISDIFRIPKFAHFFYQSQRDADIVLNKPLQSGPMVYIANYWTPESTLKITVFSNCDEVILYLNDKVFGKQKPFVDANSNNLTHPPFIFQLDAFKAGTLRAEGLIKGKKVTDFAVTTPQKPTQIKLTYDLSGQVINPSNPDMVFVYAKITDTNGTVIPNTTDKIQFELIEGNAKLIGENPVKAEAGIATVLLKTENNKKTIKIRASGEGLTSDILLITKN